MRSFIALLGIVLSSLSLHAYAQSPISVKVRAILVDGQLNQKPIPRLPITITRVDAVDVAVVNVKTDFDGTVDVPLEPGRFRIETGTVTFDGKQLRWNETVDVTGVTTVDLSRDTQVVQ